ncbi:MAG TPA: cysteine hydrolase [Solirubrobacteraceae bacterium]|jgi:ureidoacrylate peracid hydrolase|nr:cysteine hydrolase [Solirubrobacteraceae bacterium]
MAQTDQHQPFFQGPEEILDPGHSALIVVDVQNDFVHDDGILATKISQDMTHVQASLPHINDAIRIARAAGVRVIYLQEVISEATLLPNFMTQFGSFEDVAVREGTWGAEFADDLLPPQADEPVVRKPSYDGFQDTNLDVTLRAFGIQTCIYVGCATNVCVESTARHGFIKGYYTALLDDACGALSVEDHEATLKTFRVFYGPVLRVDELAALWDVATVVASSGEE